MSAVRKKAEFLPRVSALILTLCKVSYDGLGRSCDYMTFPVLGVPQALTFFKSLFICHFLSELSSLTASPITLLPSTFYSGTSLILTYCIIYLLWFLFVHVSVLAWKLQGQGYSLLYFQCFEWHLVHKELFVERMDALIPYGHVFCILLSLTKES